MRPILIWLVCLFCRLGWGECLWAQQPEPIPTVTLDMRQAELPDVLLELEKQTGLFFSYESSLLTNLPKVSLTAKDESISYCLQRLLSPLPLIYRVTGRYIILKRKPRQYTISGFVRDSASFESLLGASVQAVRVGKGSVSNNYGFYSLTLPPGKVLIRASYVGFKAKEFEIDLQKDTMVDFPLPSLLALGEVLVKGTKSRFGVLSSRSGVVEVSAQQVKSMPTLLGEADLVKTLQQLPGVAVGMEGMTGLYVRGGNADENLYLLDGNPVYHVNHLMGFFSTFNPDAIKNTTFYKGSFPAEYGGRLSSIVDVRMNDGNRQEFHGNISVGLLSVRTNLEGPIVKDRSSFNVSVRRTWLDMITAPALAILNRGKSQKDIFGYHFFDINAKVNHSFSNKSRLYLSFYMGQDAFRQGNEMPDEEIKDLFLWRWGNLIGSVGWNYVFGKNLFASFMAGYSRFRSHINQEVSSISYIGNNLSNKQQLLQSTGYKSAMEDVSLRATFDYRLSPAHRIQFGTDYLFHNFRPENNQRKSWYRDEEKSPVEELFGDNSLIQGHELSLFAEDEMRVSDRLRVNAGMRYTMFNVQGETYHSLQPRLSARYLLHSDVSVKLSYSKMNQYVRQLSNTHVSQPTDIWVPVTREVPPMNSHQFTGGIYYNLKQTYDFSIEGYYKHLGNVIEYKDHWSTETIYSGWEQRVGIGEGRAYGMEFMARKTSGKTTGWVGYTLSWSDRRFPDGSVNKGHRYPFRFDNRHKVNVVVSRRLSPKVELTGSWVFASGNHISIPEYQYLPPDFQKENPGFAGSYGNAGLSARNNYQLSPYHRLDIGVNIYRQKKNGRLGIWNFSLYNTYLQPNPFMAQAATYQDIETKKRHTVLRQSILFLCMPSVSYTYKF